MLTGRVGGVYNNHGAVGTVTDAIRYVAEQKLFSTRHAKIADHQYIDCLLLSGAVRDLRSGEIFSEPGQPIRVCVSAPHTDVEIDL